MTKMKTLFPLLILSILVLTQSGCESEDEIKSYSYAEITQSLNADFIGLQYRGPEEYYENEKVTLSFLPDSTVIVHGRFQHDWQIKISSVDYTDGSVIGKGNEIAYFYYNSTFGKLIIRHMKYSPVLYTFEGTRQ